jgi:hypothetical protein
MLKGSVQQLLTKHPQGRSDTAEHSTSASDRADRGIMRVIFDHLRPSGRIMPDHVGDRGAEP